MVKQTSTFLRLPAEIRLMIYEELLLPPASSEPCPPAAKFVAPVYREDEQNASHHLRAPRTLQIRTVNPDSPASSAILSPSSTRPRYHIRDPFRTRTMSTTYALANNPGLHPAILRTCHQCHAEAAELLYGAYAFDFDTHVEAIVPFLSTLTPLARACLTRLALVKRALPSVKEFDRAEWCAACEYMARELAVPALTLSLGVVAGKPPVVAGTGGWDDVPALAVEHFRLIQPRRLGSRPSSGTVTPTDNGAAAEDASRVLNGDLLYGLGLKAIAGVDFEWVEQLLWLRGLRELHVKAIVEYCPPPVSETMAFWVSFSKSVEGGFKEWIRGVMLV
ncbi:hypothetical protein BFW01_g2403 [Lasiodiplodia theobromae]|uniref:Uncharacterized protein n=1 Tax=Lasiodiplodia theobromae TaxID=45133 RepID=A0A5N5DGS7_9PEZI|nr:uncharacterized protein LTHEOB_503 [Lasiodiplodia theobromae]KAB2577056.1 hypothetical protein DBV05_g4191 [Lasiodiplodia theobromae]KAF4543804.1 hypothetical protein LTHEOB_503 [Lasiodiplodia theobromae]KAF9631541.1 hypothetical protein BFW01_g2403 [Lasiodiplodia theobromae]